MGLLPDFIKRLSHLMIGYHSVMPFVNSSFQATFFVPASHFYESVKGFNF